MCFSHVSHVVLYTTTHNEDLMLFISLFIFIYMKWYDTMIESGGSEYTKCTYLFMKWYDSMIEQGSSEYATYTEYTKPTE